MFNLLKQKLNEEEWLSYFQERLNRMRTKRQPFDKLWDTYENQVNAISYYDNYGELQVNVPLETNLIEAYMGRTNGKVLFDIVPDRQPDIERLQPAKYALTFFLDGNDKNNFWKENKRFRNQKATYGTGVRFTGLRSIKDFRYEVKEDKEIQSGTDLLNPNSFDKIEYETWEFFPKAIHPKDFYIDDGAYGQTDIQRASDCIYKEKVTIEEFTLRYGDNKACINTDRVTYGTDADEKNKNNQSVYSEEIILYHFFDRITKTYLIVANEDLIIYQGIYLYNDGKLPFVTVQHYTDDNCIWGKGLPARVGYIKAYKSEILQDILVGAEMGSGVNLLTGNDDEIGQDWSVGGRGVNIWRSTGGAERVQQINTQPNLTYFTNVLSILDDLVVQDTGDNPRAPVDAQSDKVGIVEIMEANKAVRQSSVDESYNIGLDEALTMTLSRIKQFAPALLSEKIKDSAGKTIKTIFPKIRIDGYVPKKEDGKQVFEESLGKYGYFDLKPDVVQGVGVKVTTSSTNSLLPILERQKVTEYVNNMKILADLAQLDPAMMEKLKGTINFDELVGWMSDAYGYDTKLKASTEKDKIKQKQQKLISELKEKLTITSNPIPNEDAGLQTNPTQNQGLGQPMGGTPTPETGMGGDVNPLSMT